MKKSKRPRNRYVSFEIVGEEAKNLKDYLYNEIKKFFGEPKSGFKLIEYNPKNKKGIVRCNRKDAKKIVEFLNSLGKIKIKTLKTSGTIKKLRRELS